MYVIIIHSHVASSNEIDLWEHFYDSLSWKQSLESFLEILEAYMMLESQVAVCSTHKNKWWVQVFA